MTTSIHSGRMYHNFRKKRSEFVSDLKVLPMGAGDSFTKGTDRNVASNWPLRGKKATVWEGGVKPRAVLSIC